MKKTTPFILFGDKNDYLTLNIKDLVAIEAISGTSIIEIFRGYAHGNYTLTSIYNILPIAYADCAQNKNETSDITKMIDAAIEEGISVTDFGMPIMVSILETGIFGKKSETKKNSKKMKE